MDNQKKKRKDIYTKSARVAVSVLRKARHSFITYQKKKKKTKVWRRSRRYLNSNTVTWEQRAPRSVRL